MNCGVRYRTGRAGGADVRPDGGGAARRDAGRRGLHAAGRRPGQRPARRRAIDAVRAAGLADYDEAALDGTWPGRPVSAAPTAVPLNTLAAQLAVPAREWFLADVVRIGLADGQLTDDERMAARHVAANLGLTAAHAYGVITMTEEGDSGVAAALAGGYSAVGCCPGGRPP